MEQKFEALSGDDAAHAEKQRSWVRDHFEPEARGKYDSLEDKLRLLDTIIRSGWIERNEKWKLQSLGITLGDALVQKMGLVWVTVEDEYGRSPALHDNGSTIVVFPLTAISKRIERGESVDVRELFDGLCQMIEVRRKLESGPN
jgi:hypothetical protein